MATFDREKFRQLRKQRKITIDDAAVKAGVHRVTLSVWERGGRVPLEKNIRALAHALGVSVSAFSDLQEEEVSEAHLSDMVKSWLTFADSNDTKRDEQQNFFINYLKKQYVEYRQASLVINAIHSTMQSVFYVKDTGLKYITANDAFRENFSLNPGYRVLGKRDEDFFSVKEAKQNTELDKKVLFSGESIIKLQGYMPGSRKKKIGMISKHAIHDSDGKIAGLVSFFVDMTKEFKAEENRKLLEATLADSSDVVWLVTFTPKKKIIFISDSVKQLYGYPKENFEEDYDFWWNHCVHPDDKEGLMDYKYPLELNTWSRKLSDCKKSSQLTQYRIIDAKGNVKWIEENMFYKKYMNIDCMCFIERDITERYQARVIHELMTELFDKSEYYAIRLLRLIPLPEKPYFQKEYLYSSGGKVIEAMYGHNKKAFAEDPMLWHKLVHPLDRDRIEAEVRCEKNPKTLRYRIVRPNGSVRWLEDYISCADRNGVKYSLGISRDLTVHLSDETREFQLLVDMLKGLVAVSSDVFWIKTFDNFYLFIEGAVEEVLSVSKESLFVSPDLLMKHVHHDDINKLKSVYSGSTFPATLEYRVKKIKSGYRFINETVFKNDKYYYGIIKNERKNKIQVGNI